MPHFHFTIPLKVRVSDLNYGAHVGYQNYFSYFQEARIAYLDQFTFSELDIGGCGMIVAEATCKYKQALYLNDDITVACAISDLKSKMFVMDYQIWIDKALCAEGLTKNLGYDYNTQSVCRLPDRFVQAVKAFENLP